MPEAVDVVVVGAGPAGAATAIRLAQRGIATLLVDYAAEPRWRACGVFSSPLSRRHLADLGLDPETIKSLYRPISALNLETTRGVTCRIEYEHGHACGFDRPRLDAVLLDRARAAGVDVRMATSVHDLELATRASARSTLTLAPTTARAGTDPREVATRIVVGAGGSGFVLPGAHVRRSPVGAWKSGMTFHRSDPGAAREHAPMEGRFVFGDRWYVGIAPVPSGRVNLGMVFPGSWLKLRPEEIARRLEAELPGARDYGMSAPMTDGLAVAGQLIHRVKRVAGEGWLLVGDATGFIDPLTGEGLHRAFVSSELAADAIERSLRGDRNAVRDYDRHVRSRFRSKDVVSWILQGFLSQPRAFDYALRRLARRHGLRRTLTLVLTDQLPATRALDPRFLARLLAP